jgi:pimeloyl-ACP methyl ester carboxylesterase
MDECEAGLMLLLRMDVRPQLKQIKQQVRVIHGQNDAVLPLAAGQNLAQYFNTKCSVIEGAGHVPHLSQPEAVVDAILQP